MKNNILLLLISIILISCNSQKIFYKNGDLKSNGKIVENKKQGKWNYFYKNGKIKIDAEYLDDIPNGKWTFYFENGKIEKIGNYKKENWSVYMEHMRKSHSKNPEEHYLNKDGEWKFFYRSGKLKEIGKYNNQGITIGEWKTFFENGIIKHYRLYIKKGIGTVPTETKYYFENGNIKKEGDNFINGEIKEYFENGNLKSIGNMKNGMPYGKWKKYHNNGQLYQEVFRDNNKILEVYHCFNKYGEELDKGTIKKGNGTIKMYDEN